MKKIWSFLKAHWKTIFIVIAIIALAVVWILSKKKITILFDMINKLTENHNKMIDEFKKIDSERIEKMRKIDERLDSALKAIEEKYESEKERITIEEKKQFVEEYQKYKDDPDLLADWLAREYGASVEK